MYKRQVHGVLAHPDVTIGASEVLGGWLPAVEQDSVKLTSLGGKANISFEPLTVARPELLENIKEYVVTVQGEGAGAAFSETATIPAADIDGEKTVHDVEMPGLTADFGNDKSYTIKVQAVPVNTDLNGDGNVQTKTGQKITRRALDNPLLQVVTETNGETGVKTTYLVVTPKDPADVQQAVGSVVISGDYSTIKNHGGTVDAAAGTLTIPVTYTGDAPDALKLELGVNTAGSYTYKVVAKPATDKIDELMESGEAEKTVVRLAAPKDASFGYRKVGSDEMIGAAFTSEDTALPQGSFQYQIGLYEGAELRTTFTYSQADIAAGGACFQDVTAWLREHAVSADYYVRIQGIGQSADGSVLDSAVTGPVGPFAATRLPVMANVRFAATRTGTGDEQVFGRWNALGVSVPGYTPQFDVVLYQNTNTEVALSSQATIGTSGIDLSHEFADKANPGTVPYTCLLYTSRCV